MERSSFLFSVKQSMIAELEKFGFAEIISQSAQTTLGIAALAIIAVTVLAGVFFAKAPMKVRLKVFSAFLFACSLLVGVIIQNRNEQASGANVQKGIQGERCTGTDEFRKPTTASLFDGSFDDNRVRPMSSK